jgi:hypothetical protein
MLRKILIGLAVLVLVFVVIVATRPAAFRVERSVTIASPPERPFALVDDFHAWAEWSPWEKLDPAMKRTFEGPASGVGAVYAWAGNGDVGEGRMTVEESTRPSAVAIKLEFLKPFAATNRTTFDFATVPEGTKVTWAMGGEFDFMGKAFSLFMNMDKSVGADFERGLASMKRVCEESARPSK